MKIYLGAKEVLKLYKGSIELPSVYHKENKFPEIVVPQFFKFTINSGNNGTFGIPVMNSSAKKSDGSTSYNWIIDWGDGNIEEFSGTASSDNFITHTYSSVNTNYQITISPKNNKELGWGKSFGYSTTVRSSYQEQFISLDSPITKNMWFDNGNNNYVGKNMFIRCFNLTMGPEFNLPQDVTSIGNYFMYYTFYYCQNLSFNNIFQLPQHITKAGNSFMYRTFYYCNNITTGIINFFGNLTFDLKTLNQISFFYNTFNKCTSITENISADTIPMLAISPTSSNECFTSTNNIARNNCPKNWGGLLVYYTLTINPTPNDAIVSLIADGYVQEGNSITVKSNTSVHYTVSKDNYITDGDELIITSNVSLDITLNEEDGQYFKFTINSGNDSSFIVPMASFYGYSYDNVYDLNVDWGDGFITKKSEKGNHINGTGISHTYKEANKQYQITIRPNTYKQGWLSNFGFYSNDINGCNALVNKKKIISLDTPITYEMLILPTLDDGTERLHHIFNKTFYHCSELTLGENFNIPQNLTSVGNYFACDMFNGCSKLKLNSIFQLPQNLTSVGEGFCCTMFNECTLITSGVKNFFGDLILSKEQLDNYCFSGTFYNCTGITEEISADTIPQLSIIPSSNNNCFKGCPESAIKYCPTNWGGNLADGSKIYRAYTQQDTLDTERVIYTTDYIPNESSVFYDDTFTADTTYKWQSSNGNVHNINKVLSFGTLAIVFDRTPNKDVAK